MYAQGLEGMTPPICEWNDTHCERADDEQNVFALLNLLHPDGYVLPPAVRALTALPTRTVSAGFLGQRATANGNEARFAQRYTYVVKDAFAVGSASQDYITNTHMK
jgi:hypothetical protein